MKKILISQRILKNDSYDEIREALDIQWGTFLYQCNLMPIPILVNYPLQHYFSDNDISGILLTGGNDTGEQADELGRMRDKMEYELIDHCRKKAVPILGVCRGMQLILEYYQQENVKISRHVACTHPINIDTQSVLHEYYPDHLEVNSFHNFGIKSLTDDSQLQAAATSENDAVIEAVVHQSEKICGIMWHPERPSNSLVFDVNFFKHYFGTN